MFNTLGNTIPTDWAIRYTFDGSGNSTTGSNNATVTNGTWIKSQRMYQSQCLSWGASTTCTYTSVTYTNSYIWIYSGTTWTFTKNSSKVTATSLNGVNGERYAGLTFFNRTLTVDEEQILQLEGLKLLGPTNIAKYPKLFEGLVGYFENPTGTTELWNIQSGVKSTYVGGTNTTDNLGINRAISNPNYTWSSITYTTGYTFENNGSGWQIVTSPAGLSATGINRTTTLRNIFLFTRTLSSDEASLLQSLCNSDYPYPNPSYDLPNLRDGLVLDLNEQGKDLSGNGNNGTLVNSPTVVRQGKAKGLSYNGSNQYCNTPITTGVLNINNPHTFTFWIETKNEGTPNSPIYIGNYLAYSPNYHAELIEINSTGTTLSYKQYDGVDAMINASINTGIIYFVCAVHDGTNISLYINGNEIGTVGKRNPTINSSATLRIGADQSLSASNFFGGKIFSPKLYNNKALSKKEIQQMYYSQKGSFIY